MQNIAEFRASLENESAPEVSPHLRSLWYDAKGDWERAHDIAQDITDNNGSWIHAYLHRKEGDLWNANYWYQRAGKLMPSKSLDEEWAALVSAFLPKQ